MKFIDLTEERQIDEIVKISQEASKGVVIFKHSTRCSISTMAFSRFTRGWNVSAENVPVYFLDILRFRQVSDKVSDQFEIQHESPQVLLIRNGRCIYHASHTAISPAEIEQEILNA